MSTWIKTSTQKPTTANLPIETWVENGMEVEILRRYFELNSARYLWWREYRPEPPPTEPVMKTRDEQDYDDYDNNPNTIHYDSYLAGRNDERKKTREILREWNNVAQKLYERGLPGIAEDFRRLAEEIAEEGGAK